MHPPLPPLPCLPLRLALACLLNTPHTHPLLRLAVSCLLGENDHDVRLYEDVGDYTTIKPLFEEIMALYNTKRKPLNLVFFEDALEHLTRIQRTIRLPQVGRCMVVYVCMPQVGRWVCMYVCPRWVCVCMYVSKYVTLGMSGGGGGAHPT